MSRLAVAVPGVPLSGDVGVYAAPPVVDIAAAENVHGGIAGQITRSHGRVHSRSSGPDRGPHLLEASPASVRMLGQTTITSSDGADYDPRMAALLVAAPAAGRNGILVAVLVGAADRLDAYLRYDAHTMKLSEMKVSAFNDVLDMSAVPGVVEHR